MRMCIALGRFAVRRPTRMPNAERADQRLLCELLVETDDLAGAFAHAKCRVVAVFVHGGNTRAVIAAVLETLEALNKNWSRVATTNIANDAAHVVLLCVGSIKKNLPDSYNQ